MGGQTKVQGATPAAAAKDPVGQVASLNLNALGALRVDNEALFKTPFTFTVSSPIGAVALNVQTVFASIFKRVFVAVHFNVPLGAANQIHVTYISASGVAFDTVILTQVLAIGTQDFFFAIPDSVIFASGDEINVSMAAPDVGNVANVTVQADSSFA
jgi:hypothetical protein